MEQKRGYCEKTTGDNGLWLKLKPMKDAYNKISRILRVSPELLLNLDQKMSAISGQDGVIEDIANQNDILVSRTLTELGLSRESKAEEVYNALVHRLIYLDQQLYDALDKPDLAQMSVACGKLCEMAMSSITPSCPLIADIFWSKFKRSSGDTLSILEILLYASFIGFNFNQRPLSPVVFSQYPRFCSIFGHHR